MGDLSYVTQFELVRPLLSLLDHLRVRAADIVWLFPDDVFRGMTELDGLRVVRVPVEEPTLGIRPLAQAAE